MVSWKGKSCKKDSEGNAYDCMIHVVASPEWCTTERTFKLTEISRIAWRGGTHLPKCVIPFFSSSADCPQPAEAGRCLHVMDLAGLSCPTPVMPYCQDSLSSGAMSFLTSNSPCSYFLCPKAYLYPLSLQDLIQASPMIGLLSLLASVGYLSSLFSSLLPSWFP